MKTPLQLAIARSPRGQVIAHPSADWETELRRTLKGSSLTNSMRVHEAFVQRYPSLTDWSGASLENRLGKLRDEGRAPSGMTDPVSYRSRRYILWAAMKGVLPLPWDYLLMLDNIRISDLAAVTGHDWLPERMKGLVDQAVAIDWSSSSASQAISFCLPRFALRGADPTVVTKLTADDFETLRGEIREVYATVNPLCNTRWQGEDRRMGRGALSATFAAHAIHFQLGLVTDGPKRSRPEGKRIAMAGPPLVVEAIERWLKFDADTRGDRTRTNDNHSLNLRYFLAFLTEQVPLLKSLDELTRAIILDYVGWLKNRQTLDDPTLVLSDNVRRSALSTLNAALTDMRENELAPAPGHGLVHKGDYPKVPKRLPRYIPKQDMKVLTAAIAEMEDPYQRAAILTARWSGARRDEINRLEVDCIDIYADGTYRIRIPAGKTAKERIIPLADEAAEAIQVVQGLRSRDSDSGAIDRVTGQRVRYLFMMRGRLLSRSFLFDIALLDVCKAAGLLTEQGGRLITAHRFRHTLGTELVEAGARWRTIMTILGHETPAMTAVYAHISDPEVKADYEKVISGALPVAGPGAGPLRSQTLPQSEVEWLASNFLKTELELGGCLRSPDEGPCECDLFLTCTKFFTTKAHAPRLRARWDREQELIEDAEQRGWPREVERHLATQRRLDQLLADLDEPPCGSTG